MKITSQLILQGQCYSYVKPNKDSTRRVNYKPESFVYIDIRILNKIAKDPAE